MLWPRAVVGVAVVLPALAVMTYFLVGDVAILTNACHFWSGESRTADCDRSYSTSSQTFSSYLLTALLVKGGILLGSVLGAVGVARTRPGVTVAGAWVLFLMGIPLMLGGSGIVVWLSAGLLILALRMMPRVSSLPLGAARILGGIVVLIATWSAASIFISQNFAYALFALLPVLIAALMLAGTWRRPDPAA